MINKTKHRVNIHEVDPDSLPRETFVENWGGEWQPTKEIEREIRKECELATKHLRKFMLALFKHDTTNREGSDIKLHDFLLNLYSADYKPLALHVEFFHNILKIQAYNECGMAETGKNLFQVQGILRNTAALLHSSTLEELRIRTADTDVELEILSELDNLLYRNSNS